MINFFFKPHRDTSTRLIRQIKNEGVAKVVRNYIETDNTQDIGPLSNLNVLLDKDFDFLNLDDRLALDYINRVGVENKNLSDPLWEKDIKGIATFEIFNAIREGLSSYSLTKNLEKAMQKNFPKDFLESTARTELSYSYSHSKVAIIISDANLLPNSQAYVKIELSPIHKELDICDALQGTYKVENAPITPFHFGCHCRLITFLELKKTNIPNTTIEERLKNYVGSIDIKTIETVKDF